MTPKTILNISGGIDVLTPETELGDDVARIVENVVIHSDGGFDLRSGATKVLDLAGLHSLWQTKDKSITLGIAYGTLYSITGPASGPIATAIGTVAGAGRARYDEIGGNVYVSCGDLQLVDPELNVWKAGVASLIGIQPVLTPAVGALPAGSYGVAFSAVNAKGVESGLSDIAFIDLASDGGIALALPASAGDATRYRIYRTTTNGGEDLRLVDTIPVATSYTIAGGEPGRLARTGMRDPLPAGTDIFAYNGRLYSILGSFLFVSDPMNPGLYDVREGFIAFPEELVTGRGVTGGIYVGSHTTIYWLGGAGPKDFKLKKVAANGAFLSATLADAKVFNGKLVDTAEPVALWLSPVGYQIGLPGGNVASPQEGKVRLAEIECAHTLAFTLDGMKQVVSAVETMTLGNGGATDTTP